MALTPAPLTIPQNSPLAGYLARQAAIDAAIARTLASGWYILGGEVRAFEEEWAAFLGEGQQAVGVASGTDGLRLALRALGVGPGDRVFTVSHTAVATVAAVDMVGATPVYVDVDADTLTMDPARLEEAITRGGPGRARAVLPVHLYGHPADLSAIAEICRRRSLSLLEDCSQAHGATWEGRKVGTWGDAAVWSCYPTKNLGAFGDAGIVTTGDPELNDALRLLREYGWRERYVSAVPGENSRLDEMQAAILRVKLTTLDADNARRREVAARYDALLAGTDLLLPRTRPEATPVFHQYVVRHPRRDDLRAYLQSEGIGSLIHYPVPVHQQPAYARFAGGPLPVTEQAARTVLSLPLYPEIPEADVQRTAEALRAWGADPPMRHFCTYFDRHYLLRGLALYRSLKQHAAPFTLWVLCFDDASYDALTQLAQPDLCPIALADFERGDDALRAVKPARSKVEYYFTCSPSLPLYLLNQHPEVGLITYLDADLFFYASPEPIFGEMGDASVLIIGHRFPARLRDREQYGLYNVGFLSFRNDAAGRECLGWWRARCLEWCHDYPEDGKFADQKYLDDWPTRFPGVAVVQHKGANLAPWNWMNYRIRVSGEVITVDDDPLIFFHFHGLKFLTRWLYEPVLGGEAYGLMPFPLRWKMYRRYLRALKAAKRWLGTVGPAAAWAEAGVRTGRHRPRTLILRLLRGYIMVDTGLP